jgi:hypothetical protein
MLLRMDIRRTRPSDSAVHGKKVYRHRIYLCSNPAAERAHSNHSRARKPIVQTCNCALRRVGDAVRPGPEAGTSPAASPRTDVFRSQSEADGRSQIVGEGKAFNDEMCQWMSFSDWDFRRCILELCSVLLRPLTIGAGGGQRGNATDPRSR